jgi:hypothetical protein
VNPRDFLNINDIDGTKSRGLFRGNPKNIMDKYSVVDQSKPKPQTKRRQRGIYDNMDYRDVTLVKKNGMDSNDSYKIRLKMNFESKVCQS